MPDYSKLAKGLTSFVKGVAKPVRTFRTPDGYTFHELPNGKIVDNLDPAKVDMSWPNAKVFQKETGAFQLGDELGQRKAMIESTGKPNLMKELPGFMNKPTPEDLFQQALNKQNASKPKPVKGGLSEVKKPQEILPAAEREANKQKFMDESADPRRMYHSTANEFNEFLPSGSSRAVFVTPEAEFANTFALDNFTKGGGNQEFMTGTRSMPVRVQVKNPFDYENPEHIDNLKKLARERFPGNQQVIDEIEALGDFSHNWPSVEHPDVQRLIKQAGHDSFYASERGTKNLGIYDPKSIKSDIGNKGAYDVTKGDINEANGGAIRMPAKKTQGFVEGTSYGKSLKDRLRQAAPLSPIGIGLNAGYAGYKYLTGEDPLEDLRRKLDAKINPDIDTGAESDQQFEKFGKGGGVRMQVGGLMGLANLGKAGTKLTKAEIAGLRARGMGVPGIDFADPRKAPTMRMSEALGNVGAEGKTLNFTEADRSRVFAENMGGVGFTGLQNYSAPHKKARTVWGFGNQSTAEKKIAQNDPENTIWTTYAGSPEQHKSNTVVVKDAVKTLQAANQAGAVNPQQIKLINQRIKQAKNDKGNPLFSDDFDITDPQAIDAATTFERRTAISDALMGVGVKKPMISKEFKAANPNVKYSDASDISRILTRETDPILANANTFDVGPHLFVMDNKIINRADLNEAFPVQVTGDDLGMRFIPTPVRSAAPEFMKKKGYGPTDPINSWAMSRGNPKQFVSEEYLTNLQKAGYKDGGSAEPKPFHDFDQIMKRKDGGTVNTFEQRLKSALNMAMGGEVSDNTTPDMTDSGNINYGEMYAGGGGVRMNKGGVFGAVAEGVGAVTKALPKVDRLSMNYKDVTKRVPEVSEAVEKLFRGEITKEQYNDIVNLYKPVTPYAFVPKPATAEEAINALRGDAAKSRYGKQEEYPPGTKVGLRLDIPAYTQKGVWVNSIHDQKGKKVAYGPVSSVKNADLGISQNQSKKIAQGGEKQSYARIVGDWNPMTEEEAVAKAQKYLNDPEWKQIGIDPERHSYFYDRATMAPITGADEVIQIGPLVLGKNPKYGKIDDFEYAKGGYAYIPPFAKGGLSRQYSEAGSVLPPTPQEIEQMAGSQGAAFGVFPQMASKRWQEESPFANKASEMLKEQVTKEWEQAGRPGGMKELSLRLSAVLAGQTADFANLIQSITPGLNKPATVLDPQGDKVAKFPLTGSADIKNAMREKGMINEDEYPLAELAGSFAIPYAAYKAPGAIKGGLNMAKQSPTLQKGAEYAGRGYSLAKVPVQRQFTPATATVEATAPDLGQGTTYGFRQGLNDVLLENPKLGTGRNKMREGQGTFTNTKEELELNPLLAIDVPRAGNIGDVPNANKALRQQMAQMGVDLNQEAMAAHRFIPLATNNVRDASSALIKTKEGLTADEVAELAKALGGKMAVTHNPRLGGVVVFPFGSVKEGLIPRELLRAQQAADKLLGKRGEVQFGISDYGKDRAYMLAKEGDYQKAGAKPMSKEQQAQREKLQGLEKFLFPESRSGIPGQVKAAPVGGLQPWSVGPEYPTSVIGIGNGSRVQYQPRNFSTGQQGSKYDKYLEAEAERTKMLDEFHRALVPKYR